MPRSRKALVAALETLAEHARAGRLEGIEIVAIVDDTFCSYEWGDREALCDAITALAAAEDDGARS